MSQPAVLLLGRTNVGKSSLFNRLTGGRFAIADSEPHTTRDLHRHDVLWGNARFTLLDSGGFDIHHPDELHTGVLRHVDRALKESAAVVLVAEYPVGLRQEEKRYLKMLLAQKKPVIIAVNKVDSPEIRRDDNTMRMYRFSGAQTVAVSAKNGGGSGDLLDIIAKTVGTRTKSEFKKKRTRIVLIGRTNVGKSALTNAILRDEVRVVSSQPHTTRDAESFDCTYHETLLTLVDTAGVRAHGKTGSRVEALSLRHTMDALDNADVAVLVYSIPDGFGIVEKTLAGKVDEMGRGLIIVGNKWDCVPEKSPTSIHAAEKMMRRTLPYVAWAPYLVTAAPEKLHVHRILQTAIAITAERERVIPQPELDALRRAALRMAPGQKRQAKIISHLEQTGVLPPTFTMRTSRRQALHTTYSQVVEKAIRTKFSFTGTPIRVRVEQPFAKSI
jgi:GTP-binding protein